MKLLSRRMMAARGGMDQLEQYRYAIKKLMLVLLLQENLME